MNPPSDRVPGQRLLAAPIFNGSRGETEKGSGKRVLVPRVFGRGVNIGGRGHPQGHQGAQVPPGPDPTLGRATRAPRALVGPLCPHLMFLEASDALIFYIIFPEFIGHVKYWENLKYKNNRKQELTLRCTELIG